MVVREFDAAVRFVNTFVGRGDLESL